MFSFGGAPIVDCELTRSWGLSPGSASITCVGAPSVIVGGDAALGLGGAQFYGILSNVVDEIQDGTHTKISFVDNRVKLMWDDVYGLFNRIEIRADNPATPSIDRQKRYVHILPDDWATQLKTYTDQPYSAQEIINYCFGAPTVSHSWGGSFHAAQSGPVNEIDALTGKKLGNVLQEITDAQGLVFTLVGQSTLYWARKGDDSAPAFDPTNTDNRSSGEAISAVDTQISVIGERNRYQDLSITLEADWNSDYEAFWLESNWLDEVSGAFGLANSTFADQAALAAKARKVTLRDYCGVRGDGMADYGMWGEVSRMEIPVWVYLQDIVYKAYRVPADYSFNSVPLDSLELIEGMLCAVDYTLGGSMSYKSSGERLYPEGKGFVLVQGQQLGLLDPTKQRVISEAELARARTEYAPNNRFNFDTRNKTIIFEDAVFIPGGGGSGLFVFPNKDVSGISDSLKAIAVPNANVSVEAAVVKASLVWEAERYRHVYGSGSRKGPHYVSGLSKHKLFNGGSDQGEIAYVDGQYADDKASAIANALIAQQPTYQSGGFKRNGGYGTALNGSIDRVTTTLTFDGGITERVEFTKERSQSNFEGERDLERKQRAKDLFPGQKVNRTAVENLELVTKVSKELNRSPLEPVYGSLAAVMEKPVGASDCSVVKIYSSETWDAGMPIFLGDDDKPSDSGKRFGGVVIPDQASGLIPCAIQGIVPVRIKGPFETDDNIGLDDGADEDPKVNGDKFIGRVVSPKYDGSDVILAMVQLGAAKPATDRLPFDLVDASEYDTDGTLTATKIRVIYGTVNGTLPDGMSEGDDPTYVLSVDDDTGFVWLVVTFGTDEEDPSTYDKVTSVTLDFGPDWHDSVPAGETHYPLGSWTVDGEKVSVASSARRSMFLFICGGGANWY